MISPTLIGTCIVMFALQGLAAIPWLWAIDYRLRKQFKSLKNWGIGLGVCVAAGVLAAIYLDMNSNRDILAGWGRCYAALLHLQLAADMVVLIFYVMLQVWPKGGAVAQAAFREGLRQPLFWTLAGFATMLMLLSPFLPYFTFGEDLKMVKNLCFELTRLAALLFGVVSAAISVHEEIEGRTAITVMSKPISRRQFFLGKFAGILLSALAMTILVGWMLVWVILLKQWFDAPSTANDPSAQTPDPFWLVQLLSNVDSNTLAFLLRGVGLWVDDAMAALPGITAGFCQVMILTALATALATRLPMLVNIVFCVAIYFMGNLASVMAAATKDKYPLLEFVAKVMQTVLPGLDLFDVSSYITRDIPPPPLDYSIYTMNITLYAVAYSASALLLGLILFEDRDLA